MGHGQLAIATSLILRMIDQHPDTIPERCIHGTAVTLADDRCLVRSLTVMLGW